MTSLRYRPPKPPSCSSHDAAGESGFALAPARATDLVEPRRSRWLHRPDVRERARLMSAAWRAAGSPRRVHMVYEFGGDTDEWRMVPVTRTGGRLGGWDPASSAQVAAWAAWLEQRAQLRGEPPATRPAQPPSC